MHHKTLYQYSLARLQLTNYWIKLKFKTYFVLNEANIFFAKKKRAMTAQSYDCTIT